MAPSSELPGLGATDCWRGHRSTTPWYQTQWPPLWYWEENREGGLISRPTEI